MDRELQLFLQLSVRALQELTGRLLQGSKRYSAPFRQKAQVCIAAQCSLMAELAEEVAHAGMVLQVPGCQVRWQPLDLEGPGCGAGIAARTTCRLGNSGYSDGSCEGLLWLGTGSLERTGDVNVPMHWFGQGRE